MRLIIVFNTKVYKVTVLTGFPIKSLINYFTKRIKDLNNKIVDFVDIVNKEILPHTHTISPKDNDRYLLLVVGTIKPLKPQKKQVAMNELITKVTNGKTKLNTPTYRTSTLARSSSFITKNSFDSEEHNNNTTSTVDNELDLNTLRMLKEIGFDENLCRQALIRNNNNVQSAIDFMLSNSLSSNSSTNSQEFTLPEVIDI
jgi:hypothetical protein